MAALTPRHRWMVSQVVSSFDLAEFEPVIENYFREQFSAKIDPFLKGTSATQHLLFSYKVKNNAAGAHSDIPGKLACSEGVSEDPGTKHVYFIRTVPFGKSLNLNVAADAELLFGELPDLPLQGLHTTLSSIFLPAVEHFDSSDWKKCPEEQRSELLSCTRSFCKELGEAIDSLAHGIQLRRPDARFALADIKKDYTLAARDPDVVEHFEELLDDWCRQIEKYLETSLEKGATQADTGPRSEASLV
ncbi:Dynein heavy chain family, related [Eimeria brunetti]|uniref:Dynein heavy chain family, related n=1 Tax=Eimeria brunetti TaxID=51314 RepID=U6LQV1_9EIME|nr:Dynein heavy chain family, related [Eimeria brunetti]